MRVHLGRGGNHHTNLMGCMLTWLPPSTSHRIRSWSTDPEARYLPFLDHPKLLTGLLQPNPRSRFKIC